MMRADSRPQQRWADLPLRMKGLVVVALPVTALALCAVILLLLQQQTREAERWVQHTYEVRAELQRTVQQLTDAESAVRAYALSDEARFLAPYRLSGEQVPASLARLGQLTADNPAQVARLRRVDTLLAQEQTDFAAVEAATDARRGGTTVDYAALLDRSAADMDPLRRELVAMRDEEDRLLVLRQERAQRVQQWSMAALMASGALGLVGGLLASYLFAAGIGGRVGQLAANAERLAHRMPLLPLLPASDEIGRLDRRLRDADTLLEATDAAARASEARFRAAYDHAPIGMALCGLDGRWLDVNPALCALLGHRKEALLAADPQDLAHPDDRGRDDPQARGLLAGERETYQLESRYVHRDGHTVLALLSMSVVRDAHGAPAYVVVQVQDITARKRAEAELRRGEAWYRALIEQSSDLVTVLDAAGAIVYDSPSVGRILGYDAAARRGTNGFEALHPDDAARAQALFDGLVEHPGVGQTIEVRLRHRDGAWRSFETTGTNLLDDPDVAGIVANYRDITARNVAEAAQREAAESFAGLFGASEAITVNEDGRVVAINPAYTALLGWEPEDVVGRQGLDLVTLPEDRATAIARVTMGDERPYTVTLRRKDGTTVATEVVGRAIRYQGRPARLATLRDVTARARAEAALRESEARHRAVVDTAFDAIVTASTDGVIRSFNLGAERIFGYHAGKVIGEPLAILMPERFRAGHSAGLARVSATGAGRLLGQTLELVGQRRDGTEFPLELTLAQGRDDQGVFFTGIMRDISARVAAEAALRQGAESFASLFEATGEGLMIHEGGTILAANPAYAALHGCAMAAVVGRDGLDFLAPASRRDAARRMRDGDERPYEAEALHCDGTTFAVEFAGRAIRYQGRQARLVAVRDIRARKAAETALTASHRALEAKTREQEAFIYTVAHDLRAPLLSMQGLANILVEDCAPRLGDDRQYLDRIVANAGKLQALLDELLELARVGRVDNDLEPVPLDDIVADVCAQLQHTLAGRGARVDVAGPLPTVRANRARMVQLFANLIANAVHYTPPERAPLVRIAAAPHADGWELTVADNGVGIPAAYRDRVLGLFQRLPAGKALNPGGTGAGLAIVARIVDTHGGALWFDSIEGTGTTFHLTLPPAPADPEPPGPPTDAAARSETAHVPSRREGVAA